MSRDACYTCYTLLYGGYNRLEALVRLALGYLVIPVIPISIKYDERDISEYEYIGVEKVYRYFKSFKPLRYNKSEKGC